jgi:membrane-associated phospholipid phosphatase
MGGYLEAWRRWLRRPGAWIELLATLSAVFVGSAGFTSFLRWVDKRPGIRLPDPLLARFQPVDLSAQTFVLLYVALVLALLIMAREPARLMTMGQAFVAMLIVRVATLLLLPLEPPATIIPLRDPLLAGIAIEMEKDLFFSGHTATMFLLYLVAPRGIAKPLLLAGTGAVAACVLLQHVHYTLDVLAAFFFAYGAYRLVWVGRRAASLALRSAAPATAAETR